MLIIASNSEDFKEGDVLAIGPCSFNPFAPLRIGKSKAKSFLVSECILEILDAESSKKFLGSAGMGLVGAAVLGPLGLIAGALSGGNKTTVFFSVECGNIKLVIKTSNSRDIRILKEQSMRHVAIKK